MSSRDRGTGFAIVTAFTVATVLLLLWVWAFVEGRSVGWLEGKEQANTSRYAHQAQQEIEGCLALSETIEVARCIRQVVESENEHERAERDLIAQTNMALWARLLLVVTAFGTGVAIYGLILLRKTWAEAKRTADITREIGEAQVRAYLSFTKVTVTAEPEQDRVVWNIVVDVKNSGQSPARSLNGYATGSIFAVEKAGALVPDIPADGEEFFSITHVTEVKKLRFMDESQTQIGFVANIWLEFRDVFSKDDIRKEGYEFAGVVSPVRGDVSRLHPVRPLWMIGNQIEGQQQ